MAQSLIEHETISTTVQKAKEIKPFVERLITLAKKGKLEHRRRAISMLGNRSIIAFEDGEPVKKGTVVGKLFSELAPGTSTDRGVHENCQAVLRRLGDNGELVLLQLWVPMSRSRESGGVPRSAEQKAGQGCRAGGRRRQGVGGAGGAVPGGRCQPRASRRSSRKRFDGGVKRRMAVACSARWLRARSRRPRCTRMTRVAFLDIGRSAMVTP
jgi:large subunit ribosomal protein L17